MKEFVQKASGSWAPGTKKKYASSWEKYRSWCEGERIDPFRPSLPDVCRFLLRLSESAPSEVRMVVIVLKILNKFVKGAFDCVCEELVERFVNAVEKERVKMTKALPFPVEVLRSHLDNEVPKRNREARLEWLRKALIVGLCLRLTWRTETLSGIRACHLKPDEKDGKQFFSISVFKSKTNQKGEEKVYWLDAGSDRRYCLVRLLREYLVRRFGKDWRSVDEPLFVNNRGGVMRAASVSFLLNKMAEEFGSSVKFSSKSLRIGAVEWMVRKGVTFESIRALGWAENSPALNAYIRVTQLAVAGGTDRMFSI